MMLRILTFISFCFCLGAGCQTPPVSGKIRFSDQGLHKMVYLIETKSFSTLVSSFEGKVIDSTKVDEDGNFSFSKMPSGGEKKLYVLAVQKKGEKFLNRLENDDPTRSNYLPFMYGDGDKVIISSDASAMLEQYKVSGDVSENIILVDLCQKRVEGFKKFKEVETTASEEQLPEIENAKKKWQQGMWEVVRSHNNVYLKGLALRWCAPNGDYERLAEEVDGICSSLHEVAPQHEWTKQICVLSNRLPPAVGLVLPELLLPMSYGDTVVLSSLYGQKLTLFDLWASWCAPCRKENRDILVPLWERFQEKGFTIVGYALDSSEKAWLQAIQKDGVNKWKHASHLQGDDSPVFDTLKMTTIPANYLVDEKGKIVAKNLHGDDLVRFVENYLK
ncbi:MAG: TlpA family protein disulfide reductase [Saprospiraceae bacterium]|nr:TlpA family protein disulfide reductase [Saprospiraceae bacterium]